MSGLGDAVRRLFDDPVKRLVEAGVSEGLTVAELGAGFGYFAIPAARMVGEKGRVYAVEPDERRAEEITRRGNRGGLRNLAVLRTGAERLLEIPDGSVDLAISMYSLHHIGEKEDALSEVKRILKPGGAVYVRDIKRGRLLRHGSGSAEFRELLASHFPGARFEEGLIYLTARAVGVGTGRRQLGAHQGLGARSLAVPPTE